MHHLKEIQLDDVRLGAAALLQVGQMFLVMHHI